MFSSATSRRLFSALFVFLVLTGPSLECGPGRGPGRRRRPAKTTPLVYKQHVPNMSENTIGASGMSDGPITVTDQRYKDLETNNNPYIMFKDEEGDGSDRRMSQRCKDKLNRLAISVVNQWPGVKLRVTEAWDDSPHHKKESLHYEGRAVDITTSDRDRSKYGMLARLAVEAGFDWVYYESRGHIHCSVKSDSDAAIKMGGCFSGSATVFSKDNGQKALRDVQLGELVLSMSDKGVLEYSPLISFLDRDDNDRGLFYKLTTQDGFEVKLTAKHLIYISDSNETIETMSDTYEAVYADTVRVGQFVLLAGDEGSLPRFSQVARISVTREMGVYAPLTLHGTIVIDSVVTSCYAFINNVNVAHLAFAPMRAMYQLSRYSSFLSWTSGSWFDDLARSHQQNVTGIHWYAQLLYNVGTLFIDKSTLYVP
uniref:Hedgehog protein n=1 Tax=Nucula tumidula TaxID=437803 RepID=A0A1J0M5N3_9BIVA|nr:hedgehog [Nucula tumidula]